MGAGTGKSTYALIEESAEVADVRKRAASPLEKKLFAEGSDQHEGGPSSPSSRAADTHVPKPGGVILRLPEPRSGGGRRRISNYEAHAMCAAT